MRITSKGQVTIPIDIRERAGLLPDVEVEFQFDGNVVTLRPAQPTTCKTGRGRAVVEHLGRFAGSMTMTADEVMALTRSE